MAVWNEENKNTSSQSNLNKNTSSFTAQSKNDASLTNETKNTSSFIYQDITSDSFLLKEDEFCLLLETGYKITLSGISWTNQANN